MFPLNPAQFHAVKDVFSTAIPNYPVVQAIIEQHNPGKIWVDNLTHPTCCLVIADASYSFISGHISDDIIALLKKHKPIKLIASIHQDITVFEKIGFTKINRILFSYKEKNLEKLTSLINHSLQEYEIHRIDKNLLEKCNWKNYMILFYGSAENYLKHGFGFCLMKEGLILSEAHACYVGGGMVEIGYVSHENYRGKHLASQITPHLIQECIARNLEPIASCEASNSASAGVALNMGFEEQARYLFLHLK